MLLKFLVQCDSVFRRGMYCCVILWTDMPCDDMPCYDMPCDDMLCSVLSHIYVALIQFLSNFIQYDANIMTRRDTKLQPSPIA